MGGGQDHSSTGGFGRGRRLSPAHRSHQGDAASRSQLSHGLALDSQQSQPDLIKDNRSTSVWHEKRNRSQLAPPRVRKSVGAPTAGRQLHPKPPQSRVNALQRPRGVDMASSENNFVRSLSPALKPTRYRSTNSVKDGLQSFIRKSNIDVD